MIRLAFVLLTAVLLTAPSASAQKNCRKGTPCGRTCISATQTCRVGQGDPARHRAEITPPPAGARYVASSRGEVYYLLGCSAAERLSPANRIYFSSEAEALAVGLRPSATAGCGGVSALSADDDPRIARPAVRVLGAAAASAIQADACLIQRVSDGDTVVCRDGRRVRLLLIDAPEMDQGPFGLAAKAALQQLLPPGQQVALEPDVDPQDRYGRMLAYVYLPDGRMINEELARGGYVVSLTYPPNVRYVERIRAAVAQARAARRGLWSGSAFECSPRDHRAKRCE